MNDAEFIFSQTSRERKRNGYGDYHKKRQGGRQVRLPSDNLTAKEKRALNSDVTKINLNAPVDWREIKNWPDDLKIEYLQTLENKYHARGAAVADMLGITKVTLARCRRELGIPEKSGGRRLPLDVVGWKSFCNPNVLVEKCPEPTEEPAEKSPETPAPEDDEKKVKMGMDSVMNIAILLDKLRGTGAKLTIEVTL